MIIWGMKSIADAFTPEPHIQQFIRVSYMRAFEFLIPEIDLKIGLQALFSHELAATKKTTQVV
jgi:hypothetical protein